MEGKGSLVISADTLNKLALRQALRLGMIERDPDTGEWMHFDVPLTFDECEYLGLDGTLRDS